MPSGQLAALTTPEPRTDSDPRSVKQREDKNTLSFWFFMAFPSNQNNWLTPCAGLTRVPGRVAVTLWAGWRVVIPMLHSRWRWPTMVAWPWCRRARRERATIIVLPRRTPCRRAMPVGGKPGVGPLNPTLPLAVPGVSPIVRVPVVSNAEGDDGQAERSAVSQHRNLVSLIGVGDIASVHPAPIGTDHHVAPLVTAEAALDHDGDACSQHNDRGIFRCRAGTKIDVLRNVSRFCKANCWQGEHNSAQQTPKFSVFHFKPLWVGLSK